MQTVDEQVEEIITIELKNRGLIGRRVRDPLDIIIGSDFRYIHHPMETNDGTESEGSVGFLFFSFLFHGQTLFIQAVTPDINQAELNSHAFVDIPAIYIRNLARLISKELRELGGHEQ